MITTASHPAAAPVTTSLVPLSRLGGVPALSLI